MNIIISLILASLLILFFRKAIKKHANYFYISTALISLILVFLYYTNLIHSIASFITSNILSIFTKSSFSTALFIIVMYTGTLKNGSKLMKILMPIRAELSIIASILTLAHNIIYGKTYFVILFTNGQALDNNTFWAAIASIIMIIIMIPLMITSFPKIRKKYKYKTWKNIQRFAYLFYSLIYIHILLLMVPLAKAGFSYYILNVIVYSIIFITYGVLRIRKAIITSRKS